MGWFVKSDLYDECRVVWSGPYGSEAEAFRQADRCVAAGWDCATVVERRVWGVA